MNKDAQGRRQVERSESNWKCGFNPRTANADYYLGVLQSTIGKRAISNYTKSGVQPSLNLSDVEQFLVPLPPLPEQEAIARAFSDADALIESLEQLIAKKRQIKQGAMQELLTGKKRLPGFSGEWAVKPFGEVCWFQEGPGVRNSQFTASGIKLLNGTNIFRGVLNLDSTSRFISEKEAYGASLLSKLAGRSRDGC